MCPKAEPRTVRGGGRLNPIVETIPVEIRTQRLGPSRGRNRQLEETPDCRNRVTADVRRVCAEHGVACEVADDLNRAAGMQDPDS